MNKKVLLITGGSRGIGAASALLAAEHWSIVISYRANKVEADKVVQQIENLGGSAMAVQADMTQEDQLLALFATIDQVFGRLDGLVNNAGVIDQKCQLADMSTRRIKRLFETNVIGSFICCREAVKRMSTRRGGQGGVIVNLSSAASRLGSANEFIDYAATKGAVDTLTIGLAKEVAEEGIRVNGVRPGLIDTDMQGDTGNPRRAEDLKEFIPMKRPGTADEIAQAIVWLLSAEASYVNGSLLDVAGGR